MDWKTLRKHIKNHNYAIDEVDVTEIRAKGDILEIDGEATVSIGPKEKVIILSFTAKEEIAEGELFEEQED